MNIEKIVSDQRAFFYTNKTIPLSYRHAALDKLQHAIKAHEKEIDAALYADLNKSPTESYMCEIGMTLSALSYTKKHLNSWAKKRRVCTPLAQFHAKSFTVQQPYGVVLIISPWNYPFLLAMEPLIGAIAAGNCCIVKPSEYAPATSAVIQTILRECFSPEYVAVVEGDSSEASALLAQKLDYIFFTGGTAVGQEIMKKAAQHLTPVTLELGGKSPCIIDKTAKLDLAAKRIVFGKFLNCGQTCVAPDYVLIERSVKDEFLNYIKKWIHHMYGENALINDGYVKMINRKHFDRVCSLIDSGKVIIGGGSDPDTLRIQPTVLDHVTAEDAVMQEEIFGPVLPILTFDTIDAAEMFVRSRPQPLALYLFTENQSIKNRFLQEVSFGGGCINDTVIHLATSRMGFGGVGPSGMGSYHGKKSFSTFSHEKSIVDKSTWIDLPMRYAPYNTFSDKLIHLFMK